MKKLMALLLAIAVFMYFIRHQSSQKEVKDTQGNLKEVKIKLKDVKVKERETAEWNSFKIGADSSIAQIEKDLKIMATNSEKAGK